MIRNIILSILLSLLTYCYAQTEYTVVYYEDFESTPHLYMPTGWSVFNQGECSTIDNGRPRVYHTLGYGGSKELDFLSSCLQVAVLPNMGITNSKGIRIRCKANSSNASECYLRVGLMTDRTDLSTFVDVDTLRCAGNETWEDIMCDLSSYQGQGTTIALYFHSDGTNNGHIYIDNLYIEKSNHIANNDTVSTYVDNPIVIDPTFNDSTLCANPSAHIITMATHGTTHFNISGNNEGVEDPPLYSPPAHGPKNSESPNQGAKSQDTIVTAFTYTPDTGFTGVDSIQVVVACGTTRDTSWIYILVTPIPDNVLDPSCAISVDSNGFSMRQIFSVSGVNSMSTPMVADMDGDGKPEIIACKNSANSPWLSKDFLVIDGVTGELKKTITTQEYYVHGQCITIADVDRDGESEIFMLSREGYVICYNYSGGQRWVNLTPVPFNYLLTAADIDGDSAVELVCGPYIFRASDGTLLLHGTLQETGMGFGAPLGFDASHHIPYYMYALADIDNDGYLELCAGNSIYNINLPNGNNNGGISLLRQASNDVSIANLDGQTFVCDFDGDGDMDVCVIGTTHDIGHAPTATSHTIYPYVWDGQTGQIIAHASVNVNNSRGTSIPSCADLDGDGLPEIIFSIYGKGMYAYSFDSTLANNMLQKHHHAPFGETSGFTVFDFNQDGRNEIIHRGTSNLYVVDGTTLTPLTTPITSFSGTIAEYPVVADVNGDGIAEIVVTHAPSAWNGSNSSGYVTVYGSNVYSVWSSARRVWNQWAYNTVGINQDLTVPSFHFNVAFKFPNGRQPYNNFLGQAPYINRQGDMFNPVADIYCDMVSTSTTNDSTIVQLNIVNGGALTFFAPFGISVYRGEYLNQLLFIDTVRTPILPFDSILFNLTIPLNQLCPLSQNDSIVIVLNDYASGIAMYGGLQAECDTLNNLLKIATPAYHNSGDTTAVACGSFSWQNTTYTSSGDIPGSVPLQNSVGCDSTSTLHLTIVAEPSLTTTADTNIPQGDTLTLRAWGGDIFSWTDTSGNVFANGDTVNVAPQEATKYIVSAYVEGINIVFNGDFEMGNTGFTCGHDYNSFAYEGAYYIGTNARDHFPSFAIWHDHTSGSGQYMIVNGAGTPNTVAWSQTVDVTPNTDYAFSTWISNLSPREYASGNLNDVSQLQFSINGSQLGDIFYVPETAGWVRVYKVWNSGNANSATISILNQNSGWAGNDFGMDDIRFAPVSCPVYDTVNIGVFTQTHENISVCENMSPILWHGLNISAAGTYYDTIHGPEVDTVAILDLTINYNSTGVDVRTTCDSLLWIDGITYSSSNSSATHTLYNANINGCDSIVTLNLTLNHSTTSDTTAVACDSLIWKNVTYTSSGDFNYSGIPGVLPLQNAAGCDSTVTLHLTINHSSTFDTIAVVCDSTIWHGAKYYISQDAIFRTKNIHNCDSVETLHLTVNNSSTKDTSIEACNSFTWGNIVLTSSWSTVEHLTNVSGCDSTLSVNVTVFHCSTSDTTAADSLIIGGGTIYADTTLIFDHDTIIVNICHTLRDTSVVQACNSYTWQNTVFTSNAFISDTTHMNDGCDSIHFLDLTVFHCSTSDTTAADSLIIGGGTIYTDTTLFFDHDTLIVTICHTLRDTSVVQACNSYSWQNTVFTSNAFISDTTHMNNGCDSIHFLDLTVFHCSTSDTTAADSLIIGGGTIYADTTLIFDHDTIIVNICHTLRDTSVVQACNSYTWQNTVFTSNAFISDTTHMNDGCDSIHFLDLTVFHCSTSDTTAADSLIIGGGTIYADTTLIFGHDTIIVNICHTLRDTSVVQACNSYSWQNTVFTSNAFISDTTHMNDGCDSIHFLDLTVFHCSTSDTTAADSLIIGGGTIYADTTLIFDHDTIIVTICHTLRDTSVVQACNSYSWQNTVFTSNAFISDTTHMNDGCDSIHFLDLTIHQMTFSDTNIIACDTYTWIDGITYNSSTSPQNAPTFTIPNGDIFGCDSTIALYLTINHSTTSDTVAVACDSFTIFDSTFYTSVANAALVIPNYVGCDSSVSLSLTILQSSSILLVDTIIEANMPYTFSNNSYSINQLTPISVTTSQILDTINLINTYGCDSIIYYQLTVLMNRTDTLHQTVCNNQLPYIWDDSTFTEASTKTSILQTSYGTDSIVVRILHVNNVSSSHDSTSICSDYLPFVWHDTVFAQGTTSGSFILHRINSGGCDSTVFLTLTVAPSYEFTESYEICQDQLPFIWHETTFNSETATTLSSSVTLTSSANCDSTLNLSLTIRPTHHTTDYQSHCESYMWIDGNIYSESTDQPSVSLYNQYDCDSVVTLNLVINHPAITEITDSFCVGSQYIYNGQTLTDGGYFVDTLSTIHGCDSVVRLALTMLQKPVINIEQHPDCETKLHFIHLATNVDYIQWSTNGNWNNAWGPDNSRDLVVNAPQPIVLSLFVDYNDYPSCPNTATVTLDPIIMPTAIIKATPEFLTNDENTLNAISNSTGADWLQWYINSEDAGGANSIQYTIDRNEDSVVLLLIAHNSTNNNACSDSTTKTIYVRKQTLYAPNAFTPDESTNNIFNIFYDGIIEYEINIYNREGLHVFHSSTNGEGWDGTHNGKRCPQASYVWIVRYRSEVDPQNWHTEKGTVILIR